MITPRAIAHAIARLFKRLAPSAFRSALLPSSPALLALESSAALDPCGFCAQRLVSLFIDGSLPIEALNHPCGPFEKIALQSASGRLRISLLCPSNRPLRLLATIDGQPIRLTGGKQRQADFAAQSLAFDMGIAGMSPGLRDFLERRKALGFAPKRPCQVQSLPPGQTG